MFGIWQSAEPTSAQFYAFEHICIIVIGLTLKKYDHLVTLLREIVTQISLVNPGSPKINIYVNIAAFYVPNNSLTL